MWEVRSIVRGLALGAAMTAATAFAMACSDDGDDADPTPTAAAATATRPAATMTSVATVAVPTSSPAATVAPPVDCPVHADICAQARAVEAALRSGDVDATTETTEGQAVTCAGGPVEPLSPTSPLCNGAAAGEVRYGVRIGGYQSETSLVTVAEATGFLRQWQADRVAGGNAATIRAVTVGCSVDDPGCDRAYALVFAAAGDSRILNISFFRAPGEDAEVSRALSGLDSLNQELVRGGEHGVPIPPFDDPPKPVAYVLLPVLQ